MSTDNRTANLVLEVAVNRLIELGAFNHINELPLYIEENDFQIYTNNKKILIKIDVDKLLSVFHNHGPNIVALKHYDEVSKGLILELYEDETHHVIQVCQLGVEHPFELVIYNRHGHIGIEAEFDAGPGIMEDMMISIWDDLSGKFDFAASINAELSRSGIEKHFEFTIDEFVKHYMSETGGS